MGSLPQGGGRDRAGRVAIRGRGVQSRFKLVAGREVPVVFSVGPQNADNCHLGAAARAQPRARRCIETVPMVTCTASRSESKVLTGWALGGISIRRVRAN